MPIPIQARPPLLLDSKGMCRAATIVSKLGPDSLLFDPWRLLRIFGDQGAHDGKRGLLRRPTCSKPFVDYVVPNRSERFGGQVFQTLSTGLVPFVRTQRDS